MTNDPYRPATPDTSTVETSPGWPTAPVLAAPTPAPATKPKSSSGRLLNVVLGVAIAVAIGGVAFAVGRTTAPAATVPTGPGGFGANFPNGSFAPNASGGPGFGGGRGGFGGGGLTVSGTVESVDGDTVTIKTANGQTIEVTTGADTTYNTQAPGSASDVTDGATVQVQLEVGGGIGGFRPGASGAPAGPVGTAGNITVIP